MSPPPSGRRRGEGGDFGVVLLQDGGAEDGAPGPRDELLSLAFLRTQAGSCRGPPARGDVASHSRTLHTRQERGGSFREMTEAYVRLDSPAEDASLPPPPQGRAKYLSECL
uniref:Uncharacterized protein n=1 Tax=Rangifer tarandus platyrhynchus TaxID=3082113 RepID=A0ACB0FKP6_RANTA|nr:unnamed protein product [Rangifer tarandus platyrhynchus]